MTRPRSETLALFRQTPVKIDVIDRPRLRFESNPLTLLNAPAGYGKSVVLAQWHAEWERQGTATFWLSLRDDPVDQLEFWRCFSRALGQDLSDELSADTLRQAIVDYVVELQEDVVVVVDNYERATCTPLDLGLAHLLDNSPHLRIVVSGRRLTSLAGPLVTSQYSTQILSAADLALTQSEAAELARRHDRPEALISGFSSTAAGWPLAVMAACIGTGDPLVELTTLVTEYVESAVDPATSKLFSVVVLCHGIRTRELGWILEEFGTVELSLCQACERLEGLGLIVKLSTHDGERYGCHRGIELAYTKRARSSLTDTEFLRLQRFYATDIESEDPIKALSLLLGLGEFDAAEQLARRCFIALLTDIRATRDALSQVSPGATSTYVALDALRLFVDQTDPAIGLDVRWERMEERRTTMQGLLAGSDTDSLLYLACSLMSADVMLGNVGAAHRMAKDLDRRLNEIGDGRLPGQRELRSLIRSLVGFSGAAAGDYVFAERNYRAALQLAERGDVLPLRARAYRGLALVNYCLGNLITAQDNLGMCRTLETTWLDSSGHGPLEIADVDVQVAALLDPLAASGWRPAADLVPLSDEQMHNKIRAVTYPFMIIAEAEVDRRLNGDLHALSLLLHRLRYWPSREAEPNAFRWRLQRYTDDLLTVMGDLAAAKRQLEKLPDGTGWKSISSARVCLFQGDPSRAIDELEAMDGESLVPGVKLDQHLLMSVALWQSGQHDVAVETLFEAQRRMRSTGGFGALGWLPYASLLELTERARDAGAQEMYEWVCGVPENLRCLQYEPLTRAERVSLAELAHRQPLDEVAATLFISINTLKSHLRSIYRKLHVSNRHEAVWRGRSLGLLPSSPQHREAGNEYRH